MSSSLASSVSGLTAYNNLISIISNNIANSGTTAYKASSVSFIDLLNQSLSASSTVTTGSGVAVSNITTDWTQGSTSSTSSATDLAINGSGFFVVTDSEGATYYTRNGEFSFNSEGVLTTEGDYDVMGYALDDNGNIGSLGDIKISYAETEPVATTQITTSVSLNSELSSGSSFSTTVTVYDSLGNEIPVTIAYTKSATTNTWTWAASIDSDYGTLGGGSGTFTFNTDGTLTTGTADPVFTLALTNGATSGQTITWDIYNTDGTTNGSLVQYSGDCVLNNSTQNGSAAVALSSVSVDEDGYVIGSYSDGTTKKMYQIALANFSCYEGLDDVGNSLYQKTVASGEAVIGVANTGQFGSIASESLELSNTDVTAQLADLITAQRAYQACARVFSVSDEVMETTVNLK